MSRPAKEIEYDKDKDPTINLCLNCTEKECVGVCQKLQCITCSHYKYFGDYNLHYCDITDKVIRVKMVCPLGRKNG